MKKAFEIAALVLCCVAVFTGCKKDDDEAPVILSADMFGEWCSLADYDNSATVLRLGRNMDLTWNTYQNITTNPKLSEELSGYWIYHTDSRVIAMNVNYSKRDDMITENTVTESFNVAKLTKNSMTLRDMQYGSETTYYRVVESHENVYGEAFDISYGKDTTAVKSFTSSNPGIARVDNTGHVTTNNAGIAFITVHIGDDVAIVKVEVKTRVGVYVQELSLTIDDVLAAHGQPDNSGAVGQNMAIIYRQSIFDEALSAIQYQYDTSTREVTRILTLYKSVSDYNTDRAFILSNYVDHGYNTYGPEEEYYQNKYLLSPFEDSGSYFISYNNLVYYVREGHF
ncbi:MAG: hypothetical protein J6Z14_12550 [Prevotella sp.]|nr:hypothetical protein [Prevotella sp.]